VEVLHRVSVRVATLIVECGEKVTVKIEHRETLFGFVTASFIIKCHSEIDSLCYRNKQVHFSLIKAKLPILHEKYVISIVFTE
jgi:hypothetical protein